MNCDMCDSSKNLVRAHIEGADMVVCQNCAGYGTVLGPVVKEKTLRRSTPDSQDTLELVVPDFHRRVKRARENNGLKQSEAAKQLSVKESLLHKLETGHAKPSLDLARKLEKFFKITLVEEYEDTQVPTLTGGSQQTFTLGDALQAK